MPSNININSLSPNLRDYLLGLNLQPSPTITTNNYTPFLSGIGFPFTVAYGAGVVAPTQSIYQTADLAWRPTSYVLNQFQAIPLTDYADAGVVIGNNPVLPNASGTVPYTSVYADTKSFLGLKFGVTPLIYYANTTPDQPYDPTIPPFINSYNYSVGKNTIFNNTNGINNHYSITYADTKSYTGLMFGATPLIYNPLNTLPKAPYSSLVGGLNPYTFSIGENIFDNTNGIINHYNLSYVNTVSFNGLTFGATPFIYSKLVDNPYDAVKLGKNPYTYNVTKNSFSNSIFKYSLSYNISTPSNAAVELVFDDNGNLYGPNLNLNLYKGSKDDVVYSPDGWQNIKGVTNQKEGYLDANGKLNVGGPSTEPYNIISSLLHGGVGFNKNGSTTSVVSNNDIRNTIVGRALAATGLINDTQLGMIGAERLAISLANNSATKLQKETIGRVNLDIFTLIDGKKDDFIVPNYEITVPAGKLGKTLDFLGDLAGFTMPRSQMKTEFYSFDEKFTPTLIGNIARANGMLETTGKGQVIALFRNLQASLFNSNVIKQGYVPGIVNKRIDGDDAILANVYAYGDSDGEIRENHDLKIADSSVYGNKRWSDVDGSGFEADYFNYVTYGNGGNTEGNPTESNFVWADKLVNSDANVSKDLLDNADTLFGPSPSDTEKDSLNQPNRKSILYKTKELFKNGNMFTMTNGHGIDTERSQIQSAVQKKGAGFIMSKGNAALTSAALPGSEQFGEYPYDKVFCRTWTPMDKYDQVNDLVRHRKIDLNGGTYKRRSPLSEYSVLENTGFVKIAQYVSDTGSVRRHMFSIENLAYKSTSGLPECEIGPNLGRIMWFPPYDIKFSESTSVNWDKHNFIGRGEPMYTYNNAERTGQLSFKVIIDHPNQLNLKEDNKILISDEHYYSFFAGCNPLDLLPPDIKSAIELDEKQPEEKIANDDKVEPTSFNIFFPNDNWRYPNDNPAYESGLISVAGVSNVKTIVKTKAEGNKWLFPTNYNDLLGYPGIDEKTVDKAGWTRKGPVNPIGLTPNDYHSYKIDYTAIPAGRFFGLGMTKNDKDDKVVSLYTTLYADKTNFGLNANRHDSGEETNSKQNLLEIPNKGQWSGWLAAYGTTSDGTRINMSYLDALKEHLNYIDGPCKNCVIKIRGAASKQGSTGEVPEKNKKLSTLRAKNIREYLIKELNSADPDNIEKRIILTEGSGQTDKYNEFASFKEQNGDYTDDTCDEGEENKKAIDALGCKLNRRVGVSFELVPEKKEENKTVKNEKVDKVGKQNVKNLIAATYKECDYFAKLSEKDPFTYSKITDKIKFFSPAFHSTTPEGFNARLTFLQGCTRQGPSLYGTDTKKPDNLVFGRPPVCVLRIGDFYNTKIIIENISFDYEPLVWDLNPEGIGVQPMIANVSMNFAFIGGSSLDGPIARLQNGISRNYFANTGLYDTNADDNNASIKDKDLEATIADAAFNTSVLDDKDQTTFIPETDKALASQDIDRKLLEEGVLSLKFDDFGIFQGKVKGVFTIKSKLSKEYTIKLRTAPTRTNPTKGLCEEYIDTQKLKLNELKVEFTSKTKTPVSLQKWDYYFTDTYGTANTNAFNYSVISLNQYVMKHTISGTLSDESGKAADGWEFDPSYTSDYNYNFIIEVDELSYSKEYKARWSPKFKVDRKNEEVYPSDSTRYYLYTYTPYLTGGKLFIINDVTIGDVNLTNKTSDEIAETIKINGDIEKDKKKGKRKEDRANRKEDRATNKKSIAEQKALVAAGGGSLNSKKI